jgi:hypothetical protein
MHNKERGRGTVFSVERFGNRGECVLCPSFCTVQPPESKAFIEAEGGGMRWPAAMLERTIQQLFLNVRAAKKVTPEGYLAEVQAAPTIDLVYQ